MHFFRTLGADHPLPSLLLLYGPEFDRSLGNASEMWKQLLQATVAKEMHAMDTVDAALRLASRAAFLLRRVTNALRDESRDPLGKNNKGLLGLQEEAIRTVQQAGQAFGLPSLAATKDDTDFNDLFGSRDAPISVDRFPEIISLFGSETSVSANTIGRTRKASTETDPHALQTDRPDTNFDSEWRKVQYLICRLSDTTQSLHTRYIALWAISHKAENYFKDPTATQFCLKERFTDKLLNLVIEIQDHCPSHFLDVWQEDVRPLLQALAQQEGLLDPLASSLDRTRIRDVLQELKGSSPQFNPSLQTDILETARIMSDLGTRTLLEIASALTNPSSAVKHQLQHQWFSKEVLNLVEAYARSCFRSASVMQKTEAQKQAPLVNNFLRNYELEGALDGSHPLAADLERARNAAKDLTNAEVKLNVITHLRPARTRRIVRKAEQNDVLQDIVVLDRGQSASK
jgi:hypothetical protein